MRNAELLVGVHGAYMVGALRGELDTTDAETAAAAIAALTADYPRVIVDLEALDFIDCYAAAALLRVREAARQAGGEVLLAGPRGGVLRLLTLLGVPGVYVSVAAAADRPVCLQR